MAKLKVPTQRRGGTILAIPTLLLVALLSPSPVLPVCALGVLVVGLSLQLLPLLTVPEAAKSFRLASEGRWAQASYFNVLAQQKLQTSPWKGGCRPFRTAQQAPTLALALKADAGRLQLGLGQPRQAERELRRVLKDLPWHACSYHNLALALYAQGKYRQARAALGQALALGLVQPARERFRQEGLSGWLPALNGFGDARLYQSMGFHEIALRCLSIDQAHPEYIWRRVLSLLALGQTEQAEKDILAALGDRPENSYAWLSLGFLRALEGCSEEALWAYGKALGADQSASGSKNLAVKEQMYALKASHSPHALRNGLAVIAEYEMDPQARAVGNALLLAALGHWQPALEQVAKVANLVSLMPSLAEVAAYAHIERGQHELGCRLLHRFCLKAEISGLPMLEREQRLGRARETLRLYRQPGGVARYTRHPRPT
jgi:tetratricopeptide (TPR) repeat protein